MLQLTAREIVETLAASAEDIVAPAASAPSAASVPHRRPKLHKERSGKGRIDVRPDRGGDSAQNRPAPRQVAGPRTNGDSRVDTMRGALPVFLLLSVGMAAEAQQLPPGPKVTVSAVTHLAPTLPQYLTVEVPMLREAVPKSSNGRVEFNLRSHPEANVQGPEAMRLVRSGQVDIVGAALPTVSGDVPLLDGFDLPGGHVSMEDVRRGARALMPAANEDLQRFGVKMIATSPFPAQLFFCRKPVSATADLRGTQGAHLRTGAGRTS